MNLLFRPDVEEIQETLLPLLMDLVPLLRQRNRTNGKASNSSNMISTPPPPASPTASAASPVPSLFSSGNSSGALSPNKGAPTSSSPTTTNVSRTVQEVQKMMTHLVAHSARQPEGPRRIVATTRHCVIALLRFIDAYPGGAPSLTVTLAELIVNLSLDPPTCRALSRHCHLMPILIHFLQLVVEEDGVDVVTELTISHGLMSLGHIVRCAAPYLTLCVDDMDFVTDVLHKYCRGSSIVAAPWCRCVALYARAFPEYLAYVVQQKQGVSKVMEVMLHSGHDDNVATKGWRCLEILSEGAGLTYYIHDESGSVASTSISSLDPPPPGAGEANVTEDHPVYVQDTEESAASIMDNASFSSVTSMTVSSPQTTSRRSPQPRKESEQSSQPVSPQKGWGGVQKSSSLNIRPNDSAAKTSSALDHSASLSNAKGVKLMESTSLILERKQSSKRTLWKRQQQQPHPKPPSQPAANMGDFVTSISADALADGYAESLIIEPNFDVLNDVGQSIPNSRIATISETSERPLEPGKIHLDESSAVRTITIESQEKHGGHPPPNSSPAPSSCELEDEENSYARD